MRTITMEVPDALADEIEAASEREKMVWAWRLARLVKGGSPPRELEEILADIRKWQADHGVRQEEYDAVFAELAAED